MKIAFLSLLRGRHWGGSENLWFKTALLSLKSGNKVLVIVEKSLDKQKIDILRKAGGEILYLENYLTNYLERIYHYFDKSFADKKFLNVLRIGLNAFNPQLLVINQPGCYDIVFNKTIVNFLRIDNTPYTVCSHSYTTENVLTVENAREMGEILKRASSSFFVARRQASIISMQLNITLKNIKYVYNPLNLSHSNYISYPTGEKIKFAMIGSLDVNWKGHDIILNILSKQIWKEKNWSLNIFGEGPDYDKIQSLIISLGLTQKVKLKGHSNNINTVWKNHSLLLMPSRVDAAPSVLLEAMICGRSAVCSNIGFVEDWIEEGKTGYIGSGIDSIGFEKALKRAWDNRKEWEIIGRTARKKVIECISEEPEKHLLNLLSGIING